MRNAGLEEAQAGIKIARRSINYLRYADDTILMAESEELHQAQMCLLVNYTRHFRKKSHQVSTVTFRK